MNESNNLTATGTVVKIQRNKSRYEAHDQEGRRFTDKIYTNLRKKAYDSNLALELFKTKKGKSKWNLVSMERFDVKSTKFSEKIENNMELTQEQKDVQSFIQDCYKLKPDTLVMQEIKWKYLVRSGVRGKNILLVGPSGCGKTLSAKSLVNALNRSDRYFYFNLGATQDPRSSLIGNTHFVKETGTFFSESSFVKAIKTENAVILLDEISRAHPEAWNILMSVLDELQRYLRLDEKDGAEIVNVAKGVTFIATANIGNEYTATRVMDRALMDRFNAIVEVDTLTQKEEFELLKQIHPNANDELLKNITSLTTHTRDVVKQEGAKLTNSLSTRSAVEMAGLVCDGFSLLEIAEAVIYPHFSADGGTDSERTYIKQYLQKFMKNDKIPDQIYQGPSDKNVPF